MSIEKPQVSYRIGQRFKFEPGQAVVCNGYPGTVSGMYGEGMVEVRVPGGLVCVSASYPDCYPCPAEEPRLKRQRVCEIMANFDEAVDPDRIGFYDSIESLAAKVRESKIWTMGETFVYFPSSDRYLILKQVAPSSCEMMTVSHAGFHDVMTAYRFSQADLEQALQNFFLQPPQQQEGAVMGVHVHLRGPFGCEAPPSCDAEFIRVINADLGEGKPYAAIAKVFHRRELTLEENLATAELFRRAPELRNALDRLEALVAHVVRGAQADMVNGISLKDLMSASHEARSILSCL